MNMYNKNLGDIIEDVEDYITGLTTSEEEEIAAMVATFPDVLNQAIIDWAKYKVGSSAGLFTNDQKNEVITWFKEFPRLWETIKPSFYPPYSRAGDGTAERTELFMIQFQNDPVYYDNLGLAPIIIAGIAIAATLGIAGAIWGVGYIKKQNNISNLISGVVDGNIPANVLNEAITQESGSAIGILDTITGGVTVLLFGATVYLTWPILKDLFRKQ